MNINFTKKYKELGYQNIIKTKEYKEGFEQTFFYNHQKFEYEYETNPCEYVCYTVGVIVANLSNHPSRLFYIPNGTETKKGYAEYIPFDCFNTVIRHKDDIARFEDLLSSDSSSSLWKLYNKSVIGITGGFVD